MTRLSVLLPLALFAAVPFLGQTATPITLPAGTPLPVSLTEHVPLRPGVPLRARLLYPVYADNILVLPAGTVVTGTVTQLTPDHARRVRSRFNGDFTPFATPVVRFSTIVLADGTSVPIVAGTATDGAPVYRITAKANPRGGMVGGFVRDEFDIGIQTVKDTIHYIFDPGKSDRAKLLLYSQLPYHPQRIDAGTAWTIETDAPLTVAPQLAPPEPPRIERKASGKVPLKASTSATEPKSWMIQAYLREGLTSATTQAGQGIQATVAEPIYNEDHTIAVPQGATLLGSVTRSKPARNFGRSGNLQFDFRQLILPGGTTQNVQATIAGVDGGSAQDLAMNSEGKVQPKPQDKILMPLLMASLASRPFDQDGGAAHQLGKNAVASNSVGLVGFILGTASHSANIAAGFGVYGAVLSIYDRWLHRGREVTFARDTRIVVQTTPRSSTTLKNATR